MPVSKEGFGTLENGKKVHKFVLTNENGVIVEVSIHLFFHFFFIFSENIANPYVS